MIKVIISLVIIYILNIIDYFQTIYAVSLAGIGVEANPIGRAMIESGYGWIGKFIIVPIMLILIGIMIKLQSNKVLQKVQKWLILLLLFLYIIVITNNFNVLYCLGAFE